MLYHATYNPNFDPKKVVPGTHFGTLHAAMSRAKEKSYHHHGKIPLKVHAFKYNTPGKSAEFKDTGSNSNSEIVEQLEREKIIKERKTPFKDPRDKWLANLDSDVIKKHLHRELKKKGITHLTYTNHFEDPQSKSHI